MRHLLLIATENPHKLRELRALVADLHVEDDRWEVRTASELGLSAPKVIEDGATFEDNARKKAEAIAALSKALTLADDSGLEVDVLDGRPGVHSARFAHERASDAENNAALLAALRPHLEHCRAQGTEPQLSARFRCVLCLLDPYADADERLTFVRGECAGRLVTEPRGGHGFGYDPLFLVDGVEPAATFAELDERAKHAHSHRGRAMAAMREVLRARLTARRAARLGDAAG